MRLRAGYASVAALLATALAYLSAATVPKPDQGWRSDVQLRAMADELPRSMTLRLNELDKPYFIQYTSEDSEAVSIAAELGGLTQSVRLRLRRPGATLRVGDYAFDNSNSLFSGPARLGPFPIDDDYGVMRTALWRSTDALYKTAVDQITRKRNALRELSDPDKTPDLAHARAVQVIDPIPRFSFDQTGWASAVRDASARFENHPAVLTSTARLEAVGLTYRLVNSEGTVMRIPEEIGIFQARATGRSADGQRIWNHAFLVSGDLEHIADAQAMARAADQVATETEAQIEARKGEDYSGPVLFEREAAAQMMAQVLTDTIRLRRKPVAPPGAGNAGLQGLESKWAARVGAKVVPNWLTAFDDPLAETFHGQVLAGHYRIDDEGVPAQRVSLIEGGTFKGFLTSREPVRNLNGSNGHGRIPGRFGEEQAVIGNLFIEASQGVPEAKLKARLLEKVKAAGLEYGLVIKRIDFPTTAPLEELQNALQQAQKEGVARTLNAPLLVYKVYLDGREQLVRGLRFQEFSAKDLRDIDAASDQPFVFNYANNGSSLNASDFSESLVTSSVICPSLLFDSVDLVQADNEGNVAPVVAPPALEEAAARR